MDVKVEVEEKEEEEEGEGKDLETKEKIPLTKTWPSLSNKAEISWYRLLSSCSCWLIW